MACCAAELRDQLRQLGLHHSIAPLDDLGPLHPGGARGHQLGLLELLLGDGHPVLGVNQCPPRAPAAERAHMLRLHVRHVRVNYLAAARLSGGSLFIIG
ncbi:MAG TPA: hypothetical protein VMC04_15315 [Verrucomicrobiae bacterium]|jgi:hypothetical protein|nr:hypothetical protein [Verrucomicrobiae bacterium]